MFSVWAKKKIPPWLCWVSGSQQAEDVLTGGRPCTGCRNSIENSPPNCLSPGQCSFSLFICKKLWPSDWLPARGGRLYFHFCPSVTKAWVKSTDQATAATVKTLALVSVDLPSVLELQIAWLLAFDFNPSAFEHLQKHTSLWRAVLSLVPFCLGLTLNHMQE